MRIKDPARFRKWAAAFGRFVLTAILAGLLAVPAVARDPQEWPPRFSLAPRSGDDSLSALGRTGSARAARAAAAAIAFPETRDAGVPIPSGHGMRPVAWAEAIQAGRPPVKTGKVAIQLLAGAAVTASAFTLSILTASEYTLDDDEAMHRRMTTWYMVGGAALTPLVVYLIGNSGPQTGSMGRTYLCGLAGDLAGTVLLFLSVENDSALAYIAFAVSALVPAVGAVIGFNSGRRYDSPPQVQASLLSVTGRKLRLGIPAPQVIFSGLGKKSLGLAIRIFEAEL